jgi:hypothetical protein
MMERLTAGIRDPWLGYSDRTAGIARHPRTRTCIWRVAPRLKRAAYPHRVAAEHVTQWVLLHKFCTVGGVARAASPVPVA